MFYEEEFQNGQWFFRTAPDGPLYNNYKKNEEIKLKRQKERQKKQQHDWYMRTRVLKGRTVEIQCKYESSLLDKLIHKIMEDTGETKADIAFNIGLDSNRLSKIRSGIIKISSRVILDIHEVYAIPVAEIRKALNLPRQV